MGFKHHDAPGAAPAGPGRAAVAAANPGAMVTEGSVFPPASLIAGLPAKKIGQRDSRRDNRLNAWQYHRNAQAYLAGNHRAWDGDEYEVWLEAKRAEVETDQDLLVLADD